VDALKTKADGGGQSAFQCSNANRNPTPSRGVQQERGKAAAIYGGMLLRESRGIVESINKRGPGPGIKFASRRLRAALDSLDWIIEYSECEARP